MKHFSDQVAKVYVWFWDMKISFQPGSLLHGVKGSSVFQRKMHNLRRKYVRYRYESNTAVFILLSATKRAKFYLQGTINGRVRVFGYGIYSLTDAH